MCARACMCACACMHACVDSFICVVRAYARCLRCCHRFGPPREAVDGGCSARRKSVGHAAEASAAAAASCDDGGAVAGTGLADAAEVGPPPLSAKSSAAAVAVVPEEAEAEEQEPCCRPWSHVEPAVVRFRRDHPPRLRCGVCSPTLAHTLAMLVSVAMVPDVVADLITSSMYSCSLCSWPVFLRSSCSVHGVGVVRLGPQTSCSAMVGFARRSSPSPLAAFSAQP